MDNYKNSNTEYPTPKSFKKERWIWACAVIIIIFLFIFSMFHLQQRGHYNTDDVISELNYYPVDNENFDWENSSDSEINQYINSLQLQYDNASLNGSYQQVEVAGMNLAMGYLKIHDRPQAIEILTKLKEQFSYDAAFVTRCNKIIEKIK